MCGTIRFIVTAVILLPFLASGPIAQTRTEQPKPAEQPKAAEAPSPAPAPPPAAVPEVPKPESFPPPSVTVLESQEVQGILGREVRTAADENMGRIVDVIVDGAGQVRAAIIDFGGFLGVGSRKIAVDWKALHFAPAAPKRYRIFLELTRDQVRAAPEYKERRAIVVLGPSGSLEPLRFEGEK
jgi:hypothetical protein